MTDRTAEIIAAINDYASKTRAGIVDGYFTVSHWAEVKPLLLELQRINVDTALAVTIDWASEFFPLPDDATIRATLRAIAR